MVYVIFQEQNGKSVVKGGSYLVTVECRDWNAACDVFGKMAEYRWNTDHRSMPFCSVSSGMHEVAGGD